MSISHNDNAVTMTTVVLASRRWVKEEMLVVTMEAMIAEVQLEPAVMDNKNNKVHQDKTTAKMAQVLVVQIRTKSMNLLPM